MWQLIINFIKIPQFINSDIWALPAAPKKLGMTIRHCTQKLIAHPVTTQHASVMGSHTTSQPCINPISYEG